MQTSSAPLAAARRQAGPGVWYPVMSGFLWGTGGLTGTAVSQFAGLSPVAVASYRLAIGGSLIVAFLAVGRQPVPRIQAAWIRIALVGSLAAIFQASYFAAVSLTSVALATLITIGTSPILVLTVERLTGRRRVDRLMLAAVCLALAGLVLLVGLPSGGFGASAVLAGCSLAVLAAASFAAMTLVVARPVPGLDGLTETGFGFTFGALMLLPFAQATDGLTFSPTLTSVALLVALGTAPTAMAYPLYFRGLRTAGAGTASVLALLEPLTGTLLAVLLLDDRLGGAGITGAALLGAAMLLSARASRADQA
ncbi:DMT family transporter [Micromonospora chersina]|uniref:DMT family transporter n=1 Tax=Micromonospora chersina TaxID=47854 RepID=UPI0037141558